MEPFFDLASLAKPLVTAPLALTHLDLDEDRRDALGFQGRPEPLTVRQLLSHSSGLPPWLPFTGEPLARQLERGFPEGTHPLLRSAAIGTSTYSDLGFRLLAQLLEQETGKTFATLAAPSGLSLAPWDCTPVEIPDGPDAVAWPLAAPETPVPARSLHLPHDANARAGMKGHAGFGATPSQMHAAVARWIEGGFPSRMAVDTATAADRTRWGLGLQRALAGPGRLGGLLARVPDGFSGIHVVASTETDLAPEAPVAGPEPGLPTEWWMHFGFTGPALFVRPRDGAAIVLLLHRQGPQGEMLNLPQLQARRWRALSRFLGRRLPWFMLEP